MIVGRFLLYRAPALAYMAAIFYASDGPVTVPLGVSDKTAHLAAYGGLAVVIFWAIHEQLRPSARPGGYWLPGLLTVLYGASDELHQWFVPSRNASLGDLAADTAGALAALALLYWTPKVVSLFRERASG